MSQFSHIKNMDKFNKQVDFSGFTVGKIRPCDIDLQFEFGGKLFVTVEFKQKGKKMGIGQRLMSHRMNDMLQAGLEAEALKKGYEDAQEAGYAAFFLVCEHPDVAVPDGASSDVAYVYYKGEKREFDDMNLSEFLEKIGRNLGNAKCEAAGKAGLASINASSSDDSFDISYDG